MKNSRKKYLLYFISLLLCLYLFQGCGADVSKNIIMDDLSLNVDQIEELMIFDEISSTIRYFYPNKRTEVLDWNKFMAYATDQIITNGSKDDNLSRLQGLLKPIAPELIFSDEPIVGREALTESNRDDVFYHCEHIGYKSDVGKTSVSQYFHNEIVTESLERVLNKYEDQYFSIEIRENLFISIPIYLSEDRYFEKEGIYKGNFNDLRKKVEKFSAVYGSREIQIADLLVLSGFVNNLYAGYDGVDLDWNESLEACIYEILIEAENYESTGMLKQLKKLNNTYARMEMNTYSKRGYLPAKFQWIDGTVVVTKSRSDLFEIGDMVISINGITPEKFSEANRAIQVGNKAVSEYFMINKKGELNTLVSMNIQRNGETIEIEAPYSEISMIRHNSDLEQLSELPSNIMYVKLEHGFSIEDFKKNMELINTKQGLIVDCSDYSTGLDIYEFLSLFATKEFESYGEMVLTMYEPGFDNAQYEQSLPMIMPNEVCVKVPVVFISDVTTVGNIEEMLNIVKAEKFGLVVGKNTAGFSGGITYLMLPSENAIRLNSTIYAFKENVIGNEGVKPDIEVIRSHEEVINFENTYVDRAVQVIIDGF